MCYIFLFFFKLKLFIKNIFQAVLGSQENCVESTEFPIYSLMEPTHIQSLPHQRGTFITLEPVLTHQGFQVAQ